MQNIFDSCIKTKVIFYTFQNNIYIKLFSFTKFALIFLTSKTLKNFEEINLKETPPHLT